MRSIIEFGQEWYGDAAGPLRRADPLLMGAAFAFNALFALVPLAIAFVSLLTLFEVTQRILDDLQQLINEALPPDVALFLSSIINDSIGALEENRIIIMFITVPIALWSGSRAVYTVQKALRLVENSHHESGYLRMRLTGILVTFGAGVAVVVAYLVGVVGRIFFQAIAEEFGAQGQVIAQLMMGAVAALWVFALLFAIYKWGAPSPVPRTAVTSALVTGILIVGTRVAFGLVPSEAAASVAVFGAIGIILIWLYGVGMVVVGAPIAIGSLLRVLQREQHR
ncbi:MAG: YhjD/YihY/BrkB family envelope integrity protein [Actinomycetota bacterium]|nr:YhjD/YihY/BrkB family envelope integrity protein [Actinomycetota bacterium]MDK1016297.1 YhjD/YihY/BrkB family envelope integrity protein [Actinomycetota bacterium]MDK1026053.1 YhjD/YihY/BrkB family envelope integrity protein [Actinomycetota bacterium]MDK1038146.1 YhjD/YihY/BrkB family envelope integrity protein [Actinomycetota bacterium]MDK1096706.1 YhjD/YihY/BrkB family envelope integrity protein [Actinomycetota bacterium]